MNYARNNYQTSKMSQNVIATDLKAKIKWLTLISYHIFLKIVYFETNADKLFNYHFTTLNIFIIKEILIIEFNAILANETNYF